MIYGEKMKYKKKLMFGSQTINICAHLTIKSINQQVAINIEHCAAALKRLLIILTE